MTQGAQTRCSDNLEEWDGVGDDREVQDKRGHIYIYGWFMLIYDRNQHNTVKSNLSTN